MAFQGAEISLMPIKSKKKRKHLKCIKHPKVYMMREKPLFLFSCS